MAGFDGPDYTPATGAKAPNGQARSAGGHVMKNALLYRLEEQPDGTFKAYPVSPLDADTWVDSFGERGDPPIPAGTGGSALSLLRSISRDVGGGTSSGLFPTGARLAANNLALPTAPDVLATLMAYDGTNLDMLITESASVPNLRVAIYNGADPLNISGFDVDAQASGSANKRLWVDAAQRILNPAGTLDRVRGNVTATGLASAARTATTSTPDQTNYNGRGCRAYVDVTAVPGIETVTVTIEVKDPVSGTYTAILTGAALVATGHVIYTVYPDATVTANLAASLPLSRTWRVKLTHSASGSFTYSVGLENLL